MKASLLAGLLWLPILLMAEQEQANQDLFTHAYTVRPDFFQKLEEEQRGGIPPIAAQKALESQGVVFGQGAAVVYNPATSTLVVRNTKEQMELVEVLVDHVNQLRDIQVYITIREVTIPNNEAEELGFDWLVGPVAVPAAPGPPEGKGVVLDSMEAFREEFSRPPTLPEAKPGNEEPTTAGISGVFTDPQFQVVIRALNQKKGVDILSAPSVMTRSGMPALIQVKEKRWGVVPVVGADHSTIELELYLPSHGEPLYGKNEEPRPSASVVIWDSQSVAWSEKLDDEKTRTVFIKAQLLDPAGLPVHEERKRPEPPAAPAPGDPTIEDLQGFNERHRVREGDTLFGIARANGISVRQLSDVNFLSSNLIKVGQVLRVPGD
ncbi:MAG: LysM peptidoglycan-binding domain-containing protein [Verrucomicrobiota bacterium]